MEMKKYPINIQKLVLSIHNLFWSLKYFKFRELIIFAYFQLIDYFL
jgi:hypothetical protein